jgi:hypothetical protein
MLDLLFGAKFFLPIEIRGIISYNLFLVDHTDKTNLSINFFTTFLPLRHPNISTKFCQMISYTNFPHQD